MLEDHSRSKYGVGGIPYFDHNATTYNFYQNLHGYLSLYVGDVYKDNSNFTVLQHKEMIDRCFLHDSVEQIMESLKQEQHPFADEMLQRMQANSMLSMKIALKMLRKAKNMAYGEVLQMEMNASLNKTEDKDFELGVSQILLKPPARGQKPTNPGFQQNISDS